VPLGHIKQKATKEAFPPDADRPAKNGIERPKRRHEQRGAKWISGNWRPELWFTKNEK
jgi:hypothetical protein